MNKFFVVVTVCAAFNFACGSEEMSEPALLTDTAASLGTLDVNVPAEFDGIHPELPPTRHAIIADNPHTADWLTKDLGAPEIVDAKKTLRPDTFGTKERLAFPETTVLEPSAREHQIEPEAPCFALGFNGQTRGYIEDSSDIEVDLNTGTTIEAWVRIDDQRGTIISKKGSVDEPYWTIGYEAGALLFTIASDARHESIFAAAIPTSEWFHFAVVRSANIENEVEIFIDGVPSAELIQIGKEAEAIANDYPVLIGVDDADAHMTFQGALARLHIASGVRYTDAFEPGQTIRTMAGTFGAWNFNHVAQSSVRNRSQKNHSVFLDGPIFGEHTSVCN